MQSLRGGDAKARACLLHLVGEGLMSSLYEAVALVVLVALIGFWEWRSAAVLALLPKWHCVYSNEAAIVFCRHP